MKSLPWKKLAAVAALVSVTSCATVPANPRLPLPPSIPDIPEESFDCLPDEVFDHVILLRERAQTLENIIRSTH